MRKVLLSILLLICCTIFVVCSYQPWNTYFHNFNLKHKKYFATNKGRHGDLYDLSQLSRFRDEKHNDHKLIYANDSLPKDIDLYGFTDSYLWPFFDTAAFYSRVNKLTYVHNALDHPPAFMLDHSKTNVLLLEYAERNVRYMLSNPEYLKAVLPVLESNAVGHAGGSAGSKGVKDFIYGSVFNKNINNNLEHAVWDYPAFASLKEFKADMNYKLFNSIAPDVSISANSDQLYYTPTIDTSGIMSSFRLAGREEAAEVVGRLNLIQEAALKVGFAKVYFVIVPNTVSILEPNYKGLRYNGFAEQVLHSPDMKVQSFNLFPAFRRLNKTVFWPSDSHWNWNGAYLWLGMFNDELRKVN